MAKFQFVVEIDSDTEDSATAAMQFMKNNVYDAKVVSEALPVNEDGQAVIGLNNVVLTYEEDEDGFSSCQTMTDLVDVGPVVDEHGQELEIVEVALQLPRIN